MVVDWEFPVALLPDVFTDVSGPGRNVRLFLYQHLNEQKIKPADETPAGYVHE